MKHALLCAILLCMPIRSAVLRQSSREGSASDLAANPRVHEALEWFSSNRQWINDEHARITAIPAPPFQEAERAAAIKTVFVSAGLRTQIDSTGNVIGELRGVNDREVVLLSAHLDTVFPAGTEIRVRREGSRILAPGVSDNGAGLAALVAVARALQAAHLKPQRTIVFAANVGEEGEGNLRGMRALVDAYRDRLKAVLVLDGAGTDHTSTMALASRRIEVIVTGPGGHSWSDFGLPNPINALVRGAQRFINTRVPANPRTTFNIGEIQGGTSVNSIPHEARLKVDMRSESDDALVKLESALRESIAAGVRDEMESARERNRGNLEWKLESLGSRPGGELAANSPLLSSLRAADEFLGMQSRLERSSTDANLPISLGIDAMAIGAGGLGGGAHSLQEWYDPAGRELGLKRVLLTLLGISGVSAEKSK